MLSKTLIFLFIPIYAVIFYALFFKRQPFIAAHAIVATHLWSFILVLLGAVVPAIAGAACTVPATRTAASLPSRSHGSSSIWSGSTGSCCSR